MQSVMLDAFANKVTFIQNSLWYAITLSILACVSIVLLTLEWIFPEAAFAQIWLSVDIVIAYIFLTDFFLGLFFDRTYSSKRAYWRDNWLNLVSSIPITSEVTSVLRMLRLVRAIRVIRLIQAGTELVFAERRRRMIKNRQNNSPLR